MVLRRTNRLLRLGLALRRIPTQRSFLCPAHKKEIHARLRRPPFARWNGRQNSNSDSCRFDIFSPSLSGYKTHGHIEETLRHSENLYTHSYNLGEGMEHCLLQVVLCPKFLHH